MAASEAPSDAAPVAPATGPVPARFAVVRELGRGGMGVVHEVRDERGVTVALKGLHHLRPREILRIKDEFRTLRDLQHPNLVRLGELFEDDGRWYFTMELVAGTDLLRWVRPDDPLRRTPSPVRPVRVMVDDDPMTASVVAHAALLPDAPTTTEHVPSLGPGTAATMLDRPGPPVPVPQLLGFPEDPEQGEGDTATVAPATHLRAAPGFDEARLRGSLRGLVEGLSVLHRSGLVHRDIKPSNIRVEPGGRVVLLDFGVVAAIGRHDDEIVGTLGYMAPEQAVGTVSPAVDWYAVGVMLYRALTGQLPFPGTREGLRERSRRDPVAPDRLVRDLPADLVALCLHLLARDPARRAGEAEVRAAIGEALPLAAPHAAVASDGPWWRTGPGLPFVGRSDELAHLREAAARLGTGRAARCAVVTGASGIGKTAVVHHFLRALASERPRTLILHGRCDQRELVPYNALDGIVDDLVRLLAREPALASPAPAGAAELVRLFPVLSTALGAAPVDGARAAVDRELATAAFADLLSAVAADRPVVLFIDDLHWADADSVAVLGHMLAGDDAPPVLVVATSRESAGATAAVRAMRVAVDELALSGLEDTDVRRLVAAVVPHAADRDTAAIARDAAGHPMFVAELARFAAGRRNVAGSLDQALWERACELEPPARRLLSTVVTAGAPLDVDVALQTAELTPADGALALEHLRVARMVRVTRRDDHDAVEPYHDRVTEAVAGRLPRGERTGLHGRLAIALAARGAPPEPLAYHLAAAGERAAAAAHAEHAAERAATALAFDRAAEWYAMALDHGSHAPAARHALLVARAEMLVRAGRPRDAAHAFLDASSSEDVDAIEAMDLRRRAFEQYLMGGYLAEGVAVANDLLDELDLGLPSSPGRVIARLAWHRLRTSLGPLTWKPAPADQVPPRERVRIDACWSASAGLSMVDSLRGAAYGAQLPRMSLAAGEPSRIARSLAAGSFTAAVFSDRRQLARMEKAIARIFTESNLPDVRVYWTIATAARAFFFDNDWIGTTRLTETALAEWRASHGGLGWEADVLDMFLAWSHAVTGELGKLRRHVLAVIGSAQRTGNRFREVGFRCQFPQVHLAVDRPDEALADVDEAMASWRVPPGLDAVGNPYFWSTKARTIIALYRGDAHADPAPLEDAWRRIDQSLLVKVPVIGMEVALWRAHWRISRARRAPAQARELLALAARDASRVRRSKMVVGPAQAALLEASIARVRGDLDTAVAGLTDLLPHFERRGMIGPGAAARWHLGGVIGGEAGRALREQAHKALLSVGIARPERVVDTWIPGWEE